ncbi:hypothetical protein EB75_19305 [Mycobacterium sp. ST-F2]|uniref:hypothetical protein n=1 Tax=Mycobacterium sp. ST-F2 TaxID=1490484 RepID=UPI00093F73F4|nr:hypothetical protein [Mycobacterium sp. ST-F2]OKH85522.1 hypothetical protein EB75_19305 [Mycobacterium sp. ST-F2]
MNWRIRLNRVGPDQSAGDNDEPDEQLAEEPQAQSKDDPEAEPEVEEPETDPEADLQPEPQARGEAFDLEAGDGRTAVAPNAEKHKPGQGAGRDGTTSYPGGADIK